MAATVRLYEYTGSNAGTTTSSDKFSGAIRLRATDLATETTPGSDPIVKGGSTVYSFERWLRMTAVSGIVTSLTNPKFYTANTTWDSGNVVPYTKDGTFATGTTPAAMTSTTGWTTAHTWLTGNRKSLGTYTVTSANPLGDFLVLGCSVATGASTGALGSETITWAYDEA